MDDFLEQTAVRQKHGIYSVFYWLTWVILACFAAFALISLSGFLGVDRETGRMTFHWQSLLLGLASGAVAFFLFRVKDNLRLEYDYSFTNGTLDISGIMTNKRRRYLCSMETKEVVRCGPAAGPAFARTLSEPGIKRHNWFVNRDAKLYYFYFQKKGQKHVAILELSDEMISVIRSKKYLNIGVWYDADGKQSYASLS